MSYLSPEAYLPHEAPMMLLGSVENVTDDTAVCRVAVNGQSVTVGVWSGWHRQQQGQEHIALGMVLGARELVCASGHFAAGLTLDITVKLLMQDERFGSFECAISANEETLATGRVNTFQPSAEELTSLFNQGSNA